MIADQKHIINKVFVEVDTNSTSVAYKLKDNLDVFLKENILPYLESYFKSIEKQLPAGIVQIPQLNLEINVSSQNNFEALKTDTKEKLVQKIASMLKTPAQQENLILMDAQERQVKSLLFFIEHGYAPWWKTTGDSALFKSADFISISSSHDFQNRFVALLKKSSAKKRSILQFTDKELLLLLQAIFKPQNEVGLVNQQVVGQLKSLSSFSRMFVWNAIIDYLLLKNEAILIQKLHTELVKKRNITSTISKNGLSFAEITLSIIKHLLTIKKEIIIAILQKPVESTSQKNETIASSIMSICSEIGLSNKATSILQSVKHQQTPKRNQTKLLDEDHVIQDTSYQEDRHPISPDAYYVQNAGLVIVQPYIARFFQNCGLLDDTNTFIDREMAVHALHYLATKKEQQWESDMVFEKFICGIPIKDSINRHVELSDDIKNQAEELLKSVIENWGALGNASTDLLRHEFLQREGKLSFKDDNPKIIIERKTQDLLVDKLPWGISLFKLPWFDMLIFTDW